MPGWLNSAGSGPLTWMLSNATSTASINPWSGQRQRKGRQGEDDVAQTASETKEKRNKNQGDQRIRRRPRQGPALLYGGTGLCQEDRFQSGPVSLADRASREEPDRTEWSAHVDALKRNLDRMDQSTRTKKRSRSNLALRFQPGGLGAALRFQRARRFIELNQRKTVSVDIFKKCVTCLSSSP